MKLLEGELWSKRMVCANIGKSRGPWEVSCFLLVWLPSPGEPASEFLRPVLTVTLWLPHILAR